MPIKTRRPHAPGVGNALGPFTHGESPQCSADHTNKRDGHTERGRQPPDRHWSKPLNATLDTS